MVDQKKTISIFGSGSTPKDSETWNQALEMGRLLAGSGFCVVNGGYQGIMAAASKGAKEAGGTTIGITTSQFKTSQSNEFIDEPVVMPKWSERLHALIEKSQGYIFFDGGTGTLVELMVVIEMTNKCLLSKPIVLMGNRLKKFIEVLKTNPEVLIPEHLIFAVDPADALQILKLRLP